MEWEQSKKRRVRGGALFRFPTHDQASLQLHEFRNKLTAEGALGALDRLDLPHAVVVALWPAPL